MEDIEKEMDDFYWDVINVLSEALKQQKENGKFNIQAVQSVIDELDLECDRRIVFSEPTDEVTELKEVLEEFVEED